MSFDLGSAWASANASKQSVRWPTLPAMRCGAFIARWRLRSTILAPRWSRWLNRRKPVWIGHAWSLASLHSESANGRRPRSSSTFLQSFAQEPAQARLTDSVPAIRIGILGGARMRRATLHLAGRATRLWLGQDLEIGGRPLRP